MRAVLALALLAVVLAGCTTGQGREEGPLVGNLAPRFTLEPVSGEGPWRLEEQRGKVVLIDLMGVNCPPCRREMPLLVALAQERAGDDGFAMLSVDMASVYPGLGARSLDEIRAFRSEFNATWAFAPDDAGRVGDAYQPIALPTKVVIGGDGVIRAKLSKELADLDELRALVAMGGP